MIEIPDSLRCVFTASLDQIENEYVIQIPVREIEHETVVPNETYRVVLLEQTQPTDQPSSSHDRQQRRDPDRSAPEPPVNEGEVRTVSIETTGDQGDGIARVERGYVLIVQGAQPGQEVTVEIEQVRDNVAFAQIIKDNQDGPQ